MGNEDLNSNDSPHLLRVIQSYKPNVFNSNVYNQKYGKPAKTPATRPLHPPIAVIVLSFAFGHSLSFVFCSFYFILVNPIASSHFHNAPQQNLTQNYSLHPNPMQANSFDASSFTATPANNFNNFVESTPFQMQYQQQQSSSSSFVQQSFEGGQVQQQQFMGQTSAVNQHQGINNGSTSAYQHSINDLLVQPTATLQQNLFSSQDTLSTNQSVSSRCDQPSDRLN